MEISLEQYNLIQRYLDNEMTPEEEINFERELENNSFLNDAYIFETELRDSLDTIELEQTIPESSLNTFGGQSNQLSKVVEMTDNKKQSIKKKIIPFKQWIAYAAAACIAIIALLYVLIPKHQETQNIAVENKKDSTASNKNDSSQFLTKNITSDSSIKKSISSDTSNKSVASEKPRRRTTTTEQQNSTVAQNENQIFIESHLRKDNYPEVDSLVLPLNEKIERANDLASRSIPYGQNSDTVIVNNNTNYVIDIYVNGKFSGSISPWNRRTAWAISTGSQMYAKARFNDGTYYYWGPRVVNTGHKCEWRLYY